MRRSLVVFSVLFGLAVVLLAGPAVLTDFNTAKVAPQEPGPNTTIIQPTAGESGFYPYLNAEPAFKQRSPINVVIIGDTETIIEVLVEASDARWEITTEELEEADSATHSIRAERVRDANETEDELNETESETDEPPAESDDVVVNDVPAENETVVGTTNRTGDGNTTVGSRNVTVDNVNGTVDGENVTFPENETLDTEVNATDGNESSLAEGITIGGTQISWARATGATRYAYVEKRPGEGEWITESMQVHDGSYYGHRYHIRMYESPNPDEQWVAMQAHSEHFDWFTLRHRVHGSQAAQARLEADLAATPQVDMTEDVQRVYLGNRNASDADGWATFVRLAGLLVVGGVIGGRLWTTNAFEVVRNRVDQYLTETEQTPLVELRSRFTVHHGLLGGVIFGLVLGVRRAGILLEGTGWLSMHGIATVLYPFIALGLPIGTYLVARGITRRMDAAVISSGSFAAAVWLDFSLVGVHIIPIDVLFQRMLLVVALGMIAAGATNRATRNSWLNGWLVGGGCFWLVVVGGTLLGYF